MDKALIALVVSALVIGTLLIIFIQITARRAHKLDKQAYRKVWSIIQESVKNENVDSLQMAIIKADKLLDKAMIDYGVKGSTMGDRLKARKGLWSKEDAVWSAHKLRNQIAHEQQVDLKKATFQRAMRGFEVALKDLGAL